MKALIALTIVLMVGCVNTMPDRVAFRSANCFKYPGFVPVIIVNHRSYVKSVVCTLKEDVDHRDTPRGK